MRTLLFYILTSIAILATTPLNSEAGYSHPEKEYQELWCLKAGGTLEEVLPDKTRVDCITEKYAVEIDFAEKWAEAVGQALYYGLITEKLPAVLLIVESPADRRYLDRIIVVAANVGISVWTITPQELANSSSPSGPLLRPPWEPYYKDEGQMQKAPQDWLPEDPHHEKIYP